MGLLIPTMPIPGRDAACRALRIGAGNREPLLFGTQFMINERQELNDYIKLKLMVSGGELGQDDFVSRLTIPHEVIAHLKERIRLSYAEPSPMDARVQAFFRPLPRRRVPRAAD